MTAPPPTNCPLCAAPVVDRDACRAGCPWRGGCGLLRCPACGYEFPDPERSTLARWLGRWLAPASGSEPPR